MTRRNATWDRVKFYGDTLKAAVRLGISEAEVWNRLPCDEKETKS